MTTYVVLSTIDPEQPNMGWHQVGTYEARDARAAVAAHIKEDGKEPTSSVPSSMYLAIPARSFRPVTVTSQTQTRLIFR